MLHIVIIEWNEDVLYGTEIKTIAECVHAQSDNRIWKLVTLR
jgi:hypothetical protein